MTRSLILAAVLAGTVVAGGVYLLILLRTETAAANTPGSVARAQRQPKEELAVDSPNSGATTAVATAVGDKPKSAPPPVESDDEVDPPKMDILGMSETDPRLMATAAFDEANRAYDSGEYDHARSIALKLLRKHPTSVRMKRVVVSSACILGDYTDDTIKLYKTLPEPDQAQMRTRCNSYGIKLPESTPNKPVE